MFRFEKNSKVNTCRSRLRQLLVMPLLMWVPLLVADVLPRPVALEPEIAFWRRVFSEIDSDKGLIHDNRHLNVVYGTVNIPAGASTVQRQRGFDRARKHYQHILEQLARNKRDNLSAEQRAVLALWPQDVSAGELKQAATRLRVQQGLADRFQQGLVRSGQWLDHIQTHLQQADVPAGLAALPHVESSFDPTAYSHVGAAGLWQFTRSTGKRFMQIDHVVDGRRDPFMSSEAAAKLLQHNYRELGSWPLAITAYNHGVTGMKRAVKTLGTDDIAQIVHHYKGRAFGFASRNFYVAFLAALEVEQNAEAHFGKFEKALPRDEIVVVLPHFVPVAAVEQSYGISREQLRQANPALMPSVWDGSKRIPEGFTLRLPLADVPQADVPQADANPQQVLAAIPAAYRFDAQTPDLYHKVERGDALSVLAARYDTTVSELMAWNELQSRHRIRIGQVLRLPGGGDRLAVQ
jgi:membrane-bound lytic murein transglycosylase D